jgi:hypothetical protein
MAKLAGDHIQVILDDSGGTPRTFDDGDIISVDVPLTHDQYDVSGFGDAVRNFINGLLRASVVIRGYLTTTASTGTHPVIQGAFAAESQVTLTVQVGQNADPTTGDPEYEGEYVVESYKPVMQHSGAISFEARLRPATGTAPAWGTVA